MALFANKKEKEFEIVNEGSERVLRIDYTKKTIIPSIEDSEECMQDVINKLVENTGISRVVLVQHRNYNYSYSQVQLLSEIAGLYNHLIKQSKFLAMPASEQHKYLASKIGIVRSLIRNLTRDPIGVYVELKRLIREEKIILGKLIDEPDIKSCEILIEILKEFFELLDKTKLIWIVRKRLDGYEVGSREIYRQLFRAEITPNFMFTRLMSRIPVDGDEIDSYKVGNADVGIFSVPEDIKYLYHLMPPEFKLSEDKQELLEMARNVLIEHKPRAEEFIDPERMRMTFFNIGRDLLQELADRQNLKLNLKELEELTSILVRYTVGFGLLEILLQDEKIQDITINGPIGITPIFIVHQKYDECFTNIIPSAEDAENWATKFRILSGRPLDEANPILDTELTVPGARARVAIVGRPLNPRGLAYALRRHRDDPWTLPLFIQNRMISPLGAGLMSFLIEGGRAVIIAGTRSSGKTSFLGSLLVEVMRKYRLITVEDTMELSVDALRELGYNIQPLKVRSALAGGATEVSAEEGIRTALRMGDSALIVGEIRSSIRGDEKVVIVENGETKRIPIKDLEGKDITNIKVPTLGFDLKIKLTQLTGFVKHPKRKKLLRVRTRTGREVTITPDHSLFTSHNFKIYPIECKNLKIGSRIVLPSRLPCGYNDIDYIDITQLLPDYHLEGARPYIRSAIDKLGGKNCSEICDIPDIYRFFSDKKYVNTIGPVQRIKIGPFIELMKKSEIEYDLDDFEIKKITSNTIPAKFPVNENFCRFLGYYLSEGWIVGTNYVDIANTEGHVIDDLEEIYEALLNQKPTLYKGTTSKGDSIRVRIGNSPLVALLKKFGLDKKSYEKKLPDFIFGLSKNKICAFLKGLYLGDGSFSGIRMEYHTTSKNLADDVLYLLLSLGIVAKVSEKKQGKNSIGQRPVYCVEFARKEDVQNFVDLTGFDRGKKINLRKRNLEISIQNVVGFDKDILVENVNKWSKRINHLKRDLRCSKFYLKKLLEESSLDCNEKMEIFVRGEFYLDEIKEIEEINLTEGEYVYDLSVAPSQNFIGGFGGILLHNTEAKALYEAMRIGSMANVVAGTLHGDSPYGVYDRVVNDLGVPKTSFKATDIIVICNPVKSADGLSKWRRVVQITEVRKRWEEDPLAENGFVDLMKYDAKTDSLQPTDELINGNSEVIKNIASNIPEWAGHWDAVWDNIILRAKMKEALLNYSKLNKNILEAKFVIAANDHYHRISEGVKKEIGYLDAKRIYFEWEEWLKRAAKKA